MEHAQPHHHDVVLHGTADDEYAVTPPGAGYEHTDASVWIIVKFGLWLLISAVIIHVGLAFLFGVFVKQREEAVQQFPLAAGQEQRLPTAPRLQRFPVNELYEFRQREEAILHNYGWVNKDGGVVRIPIEEAMRKAVNGGLPSRAQQPQSSVPDQAPGAQTQPSASDTLGLIPQDSSSGRTLERRRQ